MSASFSYPSTAGPAAAVETRPRQDSPRLTRTAFADLPAARRAGHSCCCSARPMVIAVMSSAPDRPHLTDLLLCGHHYRASRQALAAAGATIVDLDGTPVTGSHWTATAHQLPAAVGRWPSPDAG